jgi:hypothetical protein
MFARNGSPQIIACADRFLKDPNNLLQEIIKMTMSQVDDIRRRIIELEVEHRDLDAVIDVLAQDAKHEELQLRRLKKRKLQLKDHITLLKMQLVPDIPA